MKNEDIVTVTVDRPLGSFHPKHKQLYYPINYGYIKGVMAPDGEEQDAYIVGVNEPVQEFTGKVIAIVHRRDDIEDKWVVCPKNMTFSKEQIEELVVFQEQFFDFEIIMSNDYTKIAMDRKLHELKIMPEYFEAIEKGEKNFEVRYNDHNFAKGDILLLREHDGNCYTGRQITTEVTYLLDNPAYCKEGFVIMAIKKLETKLLVSAKKAPMVR